MRRVLWCVVVPVLPPKGMAVDIGRSAAADALRTAHPPRGQSAAWSGLCAGFAFRQLADLEERLYHADTARSVDHRVPRDGTDWRAACSAQPTPPPASAVICTSLVTSKPGYSRVLQNPETSSPVLVLSAESDPVRPSTKTESSPHASAVRLAPLAL